MALLLDITLARLFPTGDGVKFRLGGGRGPPFLASPAIDEGERKKSSASSFNPGVGVPVLDPGEEAGG